MIKSKKTVKQTDKMVSTTVEKENIEVMSQENKIFNKDITEAPQNINSNFVKRPIKPIISNEKIKMRNGRVYKELKGGMGMYADNGEVFRI